MRCPLQSFKILFRVLAKKHILLKLDDKDDCFAFSINRRRSQKELMKIYFLFWNGTLGMLPNAVMKRIKHVACLATKFSFFNLNDGLNTVRSTRPREIMHSRYCEWLHGSELPLNITFVYYKMPWGKRRPNY